MGGPEQGYGGVARNLDEVQVFRQRVRRPFNEVVAHLGTLGGRNALYSTQIRDLLLMHMEDAPDKGQERQLDFATALAGRSPQLLSPSADAKSNVLLKAVSQLNHVYASWKHQYHECVETRFQGRSHAIEDVHRSIRISFGIDRPEQMVSSMLLTATASAAWERALAVVFTEDPNIKDFGLEEFTTDLTAVRWASGGSSVQAQARQWWDAYWRQFRLRGRWNDELRPPSIIALLLRRMDDWGMTDDSELNGRVNVTYVADHVWAAMSQWTDLIVNRVGSSVGGLPRRTRIVRDWLLNYAVIDMVVDRECKAAVSGKSPADAVLDGKLYRQLLGTVRKDYERFMARRGEVIPSEDRADANMMLRAYRMRYAMATDGDEDDGEGFSAMATPSVVPGLTDRVLDNAIVQLTNRCGRDGRMLVDERIKAVRLLQEVRSFAMVTAHGEETYHANSMRVFELEEADRVPLGQDLLNGLSNDVSDDDRVWEDTLSDTQGGDGSIPDPLSRYHDDDSLVAATILEYFRKESRMLNKHQLFPLYRGDAISPASVFVYESVAKAQIHEYGMVAREYPVPHDKLTTIATDAVQETERIAQRNGSNNSVEADESGDSRRRYDSMRDLTYGKGSNPKKPDSIARQVKDSLNACWTMMLRFAMFSVILAAEENYRPGMCCLSACPNLRLSGCVVLFAIWIAQTTLCRSACRCC